MNNRSREIDSRYRHIILFIVALMLILAGRLFVLTVLQNEKWQTEAMEQTTKTIYTPAPRGNIYDRNGVLLAGNRHVFTVSFNASGLSGQEINESALTVANKLIENGDSYIDDFPIKIGQDGSFFYTYDKNLEDWLKINGYAAGTKAKQVFDAKRSEYKIDTALDRYSAMKVLTEEKNVYLPINVRNMRYIYDLQKYNFLSKFGFSENDIKKGIDAKTCFYDLRKLYKIDPALSDQDATKILTVRNKIADQSSRRYNPIKLSYKISDASVIYFEENNIAGVDVTSETERYYPHGSGACHIIGYLGAISESEADYYVKEKGYLPSDMVGKSGVEAAMEKELHGKAGYKTIVVNSSGEYVTTLSNEEPKKGSDVYLTMDYKLQEAAENALKETITGIDTCRSGGVIALDVKTGEVLSSASYPNFDLNMLVDGISSEEWNSIQAENPRDAFSPAPLYDNVTRAAVAPGSTFKPLTAVAAMECGLNPNLKIRDKGHIELGGRSFGCYTWNKYRMTDGDQDLEWGMGNSCNFYFACIATGKDWGTGNLLGYNKDISIDYIMERAKAFGLGLPTGIEIGETVTRPVSKETKMENYKYAVWADLYNKARVYFPPDVYNDYDKLVKNIDTIAGWIYDNPSYGDIIKMMQDKTDIKPEEVEACASMVKFDYFNMAGWTTFDVFNLSIGQGDNTYTPVQVANYMATLGNHGKRNEVSLVYGIEGKGKKEKKAPYDTGMDDTTRAAVLKGMRRVCLSGTLRTAFADFPIDVVGKTGTAQYQAIKQPKDEVSYIKRNLGSLNAISGSSVSWEDVEKEMYDLMKDDPIRYPVENDAVDQALIKASDYKINQTMINQNKDLYEDFAWIAALAPEEDPEIAVVMMLPEGGLAENAGSGVQKIMRKYFRVDDKGNIASEFKYVPTEDDGKNQMN